MEDRQVSLKAAINAICKAGCSSEWCGVSCDEVLALEALPSAQPETCEGCKHFGKWEDEYGYPSSCTRCKRMVEDNYER